MIRLLAAAAAIVLCSCGRDTSAASAPKPAAPAKINNGGVQEKDLATIQLTVEAERRLGIEITAAQSGAVRGSRTFAGEVVLPPGQTFAVASPMSGIVTSAALEIGRTVRKGEVLFTIQPVLAAERNLKGSARADIDSAKGRLEAARIRVQRAQRMLADGTGSQRALDDATQELVAARAAMDTAQSKWDELEAHPLSAGITVNVPAPAAGVIRQVLIQQGALINAGAAACEIADWTRLWVKVPVFAGDAGKLKTRSNARLHRFAADANSGAIDIAPVDAPPTADPLAATVDLYYRLDNSGVIFRPGERVEVVLHTAETGGIRIHVPAGAIVRDIHGGAWLYEQIAPRSYSRRRVELDRTAGGVAYLSRGLTAGSKVVTKGAAELFGTEFGAGK